MTTILLIHGQEADSFEIRETNTWDETTVGSYGVRHVNKCYHSKIIYNVNKSQQWMIESNAKDCYKWCTQPKTNDDPKCILLVPTTNDCGHRYELIRDRTHPHHAFRVICRTVVFLFSTVFSAGALFWIQYMVLALFVVRPPYMLLSILAPSFFLLSGMLCYYCYHPDIGQRSVKLDVPGTVQFGMDNGSNESTPATMTEDECGIEWGLSMDDAATDDGSQK